MYKRQELGRESATITSKPILCARSVNETVDSFLQKKSIISFLCQKAARILSLIHILSEDRTAVAASYDYRDANSQWVGYPLRPSEQQMLLDFAASLKEYLNPEIVRPDIVKCE